MVQQNINQISTLTILKCINWQSVQIYLCPRDDNGNEMNTMEIRNINSAFRHRFLSHLHWILSLRKVKMFRRLQGAQALLYYSHQCLSFVVAKKKGKKRVGFETKTSGPIRTRGQFPICCGQIRSKIGQRQKICYSRIWEQNLWTKHHVMLWWRRDFPRSRVYLFTTTKPRHQGSKNMLPQ